MYNDDFMFFEIKKKMEIYKKIEDGELVLTKNPLQSSDETHWSCFIGDLLSKNCELLTEIKELKSSVTELKSSVAELKSSSVAEQN